MASIPRLSPVEAAEPEENHQLSRGEGWKLIIKMFGSAKEMYAEVGGAEAFVRGERAAWDDHDEFRTFPIP